VGRGVDCFLEIFNIPEIFLAKQRNINGKQRRKNMSFTPLVNRLDACSQGVRLLPISVKVPSELMDKNLTAFQARDVLLPWLIDVMPKIAEKHDVPLQVQDGLQHYRFGVTQAKRLITLTGTKNFNKEENTGDRMIALFTAVHDIGRMMTGSGASIDIDSMSPEDMKAYLFEGNFLHPIVGAMMLREAFDPIISEMSPDSRELVNALIYTAERHSLSIGIMPNVMTDMKIRQIPGYKNGPERLLLVDANMGKYGKYAHLIALADLINNVNVKLRGVKDYDPIVNIENMSVEEKINYMVNGSQDDSFKVNNGLGRDIYVLRTWNDEPDQYAIEAWQPLMLSAAIAPFKDEGKTIASKAFLEGFAKTFSDVYLRI
jgi:hypothetical protein